MLYLYMIRKPKFKKPIVSTGFAQAAKENKKPFLILRNPSNIFRSRWSHNSSILSIHLMHKKRGSIIHVITYSIYIEELIN